MDITALVLGLIIGAIVGAALGVLTLRGRAQAAQARLDELRRAQQTDRERAAGDERILHELAPVRAELERLRANAQQLERERLTLHGRLSEQLQQQARSDAELREATTQLAAALRSSTARGNWGEAQLRNLFESAGMLDHVDFTTQVTVHGDDGTQRPDAVVRLPGEHALIVDAKAPMSRYLEALRVPNPGSADDDRRRGELLAGHARAVRGHVEVLAERDYTAKVPGAAKLVIAYLPSEAALSAAVAADGALLDDAFARGVALASPTTLWAILRAVASAWQQERVSDAVAEVLQRSSELYGRLSTATGHLAKLGKQLGAAVEHYDRYVGSLEARVLPTARKLASFDAAAKGLPEPKPVTKLPRPLSAPELLSSGAERAGEEA